MTAQEYLDKLPKFEWLNLAQIPKDLFNEVWLLLETNQFENYRIGWNEIQSNLFMKVKRAQKEQLLSSLGELERGIGTIDWIFIGLKSETRYIVSINKKGIIKETDNSKTNEIFTPGKEILEYFEWIYKHAKSIKIQYLDEKEKLD